MRNTKKDYSSAFCLAVVAAACCLMGGCGPSAGDIANIVTERDSLRHASEIQERRLKNLADIVSLVNGNLDSIAEQEGLIFVNVGTDIENQLSPKDQMLQNIIKLENLINRQKNRISELEATIAKQDEQYGEDSEIQNVIRSLKRQLAQKDEQIANLKAELDKKDIDIQNLQEQMMQQTNTINLLNKRAAIQEDALKRQDTALNLGYVVVGTKKELQVKDIIKKNRIVAQTALDRSKFSKVDIRKFTEITFAAKRPKILTAMPESSYEVTTDGLKNFTLKILNPTAFWSVSNYLVIQTD